MTDNSNKSGRFAQIGKEIGTLVDVKNKNYSNSYSQTEDFLKLLYPNGIPNESLKDVSILIRIFDKLKLISSQNNVFNEDPYKELIGLATRLYVISKDDK